MAMGHHLAVAGWADQIACGSGSKVMVPLPLAQPMLVRTAGNGAEGVTVRFES